MEKERGRDRVIKTTAALVAVIGSLCFYHAFEGIHGPGPISLPLSSGQGRELPCLPLLQRPLTNAYSAGNERVANPSHGDICLDDQVWSGIATNTDSTFKLTVTKN